MYCLPDTIKERSPYNFIGIKQKETHFETSTTMQFNPKWWREAGLCLIQKDDNYILFDVRHEDNENVLRLVINAKKNAILQKDLVMGKKYKSYIELKVILKENKYHFYTDTNPTTYGNYLILPLVIYYFLKAILGHTLGYMPQVTEKKY